jgi:hypothetical protein
MATYFIPMVITVPYSSADGILPPGFVLPPDVDDDNIPDFVVDIALAASEALVVDEEYPMWVNLYDWYMYTEPPICNMQCDWYAPWNCDEPDESVW